MPVTNVTRSLLTAIATAALTTNALFAAETTTTTIGGPQGTLAVYRAGEGGMPVLFLHGDASRASQWDAVMSAVAKNRATASFDFRGHGNSGQAADGDYGFAGRGADAGAVADALGFDRFVIVAHSGGNGAALDYAAKHGDRVAGILMVDPATDPRQLPQEIRDGFVRDLGGANAREALKAYYTSIAGARAEVRNRVLKDAEAVHLDALHGVGKALAEWNPEPTLTAYHGPMHALAIEANDNAAALYRLRTDISYRVVPDSGHWVHLDHPDLVAGAVEAFVADIETKEAK